MRQLLPIACVALGIAAVCGEPQTPGKSGGPAEDVVMADHSTSQSSAESVLLLRTDLGPGWKTERELYAEHGYENPDEPADVPDASIDPGIEDPDAHCGMARLIGTPDGVKRGAAQSSLLSLGDGHVEAVSLVSAAAVFPAEENAVARFDAYIAAMRECADELGTGLTTFDDVPRGIEPKLDVEEIDGLPDGAAGIRTRTGFGFGDETETVDIVIRRGRTIAGLYIMSFSGRESSVDAAKLARLLAERLDAASAMLPDPEPPLPLFVPDTNARHVAGLALTAAGDFPAEWRAPLPVINLSTESEEVILESGGRMFIQSTSADCTAHTLRPAPSMRARAGTGLMRVGRDHYAWHYAAVYESDTAARQAATAVRKASERCGETKAAGNAEAGITWTPVEIAGFGEDAFIHAGIERWDVPSDVFGPRHESISTWVSATIQRRTLLVTFQFTMPGEDVPAIEELLRLVVRKLNEAERTLD